MNVRFFSEMNKNYYQRFDFRILSVERVFLCTTMQTPEVRPRTHLFWLNRGAKLFRNTSIRMN